MYYIHCYHPPSVIHSDMVYDPEYMTGLYQRKAQTLWIVTSSSECYIWMHTDKITDFFYVTSMLCFTLLYDVALCVKMRYVILCIKRLLIDWLIGINQAVNYFELAYISDFMRVSTIGFTYESLLGCNLARWRQWRERRSFYSFSVPSLTAAFAPCTYYIITTYYTQAQGDLQWYR